MKEQGGGNELPPCSWPSRYICRSKGEGEIPLLPLVYMEQIFAHKYSHNKWFHQHTKDLEVRHWCAWWLRICTIGELLEQVACWNCLTNTDLNKQQISERDIYRKQETKRTEDEVTKTIKITLMNNMLLWSFSSHEPVHKILKNKINNSIGQIAACTDSIEQL